MEPAGTFLLDNSASSLFIYPNTVILGAGQVNTLITYNKNPTAGQAFAYIADAGKIGFKDLTVQDLNTGPTVTAVVQTQYAAEATEVFF